MIDLKKVKYFEIIKNNLYMLIDQKNNLIFAGEESNILYGEFLSDDINDEENNK